MPISSVLYRLRTPLGLLQNRTDGAYSYTVKTGHDPHLSDYPGPPPSSFVHWIPATLSPRIPRRWFSDRGSHFGCWWSHEFDGHTHDVHDNVRVAVRIVARCTHTGKIGSHITLTMG